MMNSKKALLSSHANHSTRGAFCSFKWISKRGRRKVGVCSVSYSEYALNVKRLSGVNMLKYKSKILSLIAVQKR